MDRVGADLEPIATIGTAEDELAELYESQYDRLVRVAFVILGSDAAAEDAVQDAYVEVYRRWTSVDNPAGYLRRAVVNRCTAVIRRRVIEQRHARPSPETTVDVHDELHDSVMKLAPKYRAALVLRFYEDLPDEEIAEILGVKRATVRSLVHRGVQQLREVVR